MQKMKIFLDSAHIEEIQHAYESGMCEGLTTNPTLIKKSVGQLHNHTMESYIRHMLRLAKKTPVSLEVGYGNSEQMFMQAMNLWRSFSNKSNNVVIKIPINPTQKIQSSLSFEGLKVVRLLSQKGIPVNVTLVFSPEQALLAAKAGATYISPFIGRVDDGLRQKIGKPFDKNDFVPKEGLLFKKKIISDNGIVSGLDLVAQCVAITKKYNSQILGASIRNSRQVRECALLGVHAVTVPFSVFQSLSYHWQTLDGMQSFVSDLVPEYVSLLERK